MSARRNGSTRSRKSVTIEEEEVVVPPPATRKAVAKKTTPASRVKKPEPVEEEEGVAEVAPVSRTKKVSAAAVSSVKNNGVRSGSEKTSSAARSDRDETSSSSSDVRRKIPTATVSSVKNNGVRNGETHTSKRSHQKKPLPPTDTLDEEVASIIDEVPHHIVEMIDSTEEVFDVAQINYEKPIVIFSCEIKKGFIFKTLMDILVNYLKRGVLIIDDNGIFIKCSDDSEAVLFDIKLVAEQMSVFNFASSKPIKISVGFVELKNAFKSVKKRDMIKITIDNINPKMEIQIKSDTTNSGGHNRTETNHVIFSREDNYDPPVIPEVESFSKPININTQEFQKIKKTTAVGKKISIKMRGNEYLCFTAKDAMCPPKIEFGDDIIVEVGSASAAGGVTSTGTYCGDFYSATIGGLIKIPGLSNQMRIYAPRVASNPSIKIKVDMCLGGCNLGTVEVYVKNADRIDAELTQKDDQNSRVTAPPKRKRAVRN